MSFAPTVMQHPATGTYYIRWRHQGQEVRKSVARILHKPPRKITERDTLRALAEVARTIDGYVGPLNERRTMAELLDDYVHHMEVKGCKGIAGNMPKIRRMRKDLGDIKATELTTQTIERWILAVKKDWGPGSIKSALRLLGPALRYAQRSGRLAAVPYLPTVRGPRPRQGFFERDAFDRVVAGLPEPLNDLVRMFYLTGWRKQEVIGLTWAMVDRAAREIVLPDSKNDEGRQVPFYGEMDELLERRWRARVLGCPFVFHRAGRRIMSFTDAWKTACRKAGVPGALVHDFRRTAARDLIRAGVTETVAMEITGHKDRGVFTRYNITSNRDRAEALGKLHHYRGTRPSTVVPMKHVSASSA